MPARYAAVRCTRQVAVLAACVVLDAGLTSTLCAMAAQGSSSTAWSSPADLWAALGETRNDTVDAAALFLIRVLIVSAALPVAVKVGDPQRYRATSGRAGDGAASTEATPLLHKAAHGGSARDDIEGGSPSAAGGEAAALVAEVGGGAIAADKAPLGPAGLAASKRAKERGAAIDAKDKAALRLHLVFGVVFTLLTATSVFTGVKTVIFEREGWWVALLGALPVAINAQFFALRGAAEDLVKPRGKFEPKVHHHEMFLAKMAMNWCDLCHTRIKERVGYRCDMCDFDVCPTCMARKDKSRAEGVLRGDKGVRDEQEVTSSRYFFKSLRLTARYWKLVALALLTLVVTSGSSLWMPNYTGKVFDDVAHGNKAQFMTDVRFFLALSIATGAFGAVTNLCVSLVGRKISNDVRGRLFASLIVQDIAFFDQMPSGQLTSRLTQDAQAMVSPMRTLLNTLLTNAIGLVGGLVMCLITCWQLAVIAFVAVGPIVYITGVYSRWSRAINREIWSALGDANAAATEAFQNIRTVRAYSTEASETRRVLHALAMALSRGVRDAFASAGTYTLTQYLDLGAGVLILWFGGMVAIDTPLRLSVGRLITFQLYFGMVNSSWKGLNGVINSLTRAGGAATRVIALMDSLPDIDPDAGDDVDTVGDVELRNVEFSYQMAPDTKVLNGIDLRIPAGKTVALVGRSGGGKSTIVNLLLRFYDPTSGEIVVNGRDMRELKLPSLHAQMACVQQDTQLWDASIEENLTYGTDEYTREEVIEAARQANALEFILETDFGFQTRIGERGVRLSGGQRQRIALARAFLRKPQFLLLDEATSALDTESEAQVQGAIDRLIARGGCSVLLVAHRLSTVVDADCICVIDKGTVAESGTHDALLARGGIYAQLVSRQVRREANTIREDGTPAASAGAGKDLVDDLLDEIDAQRDAAAPRAHATGGGVAEEKASL